MKKVLCLFVAAILMFSSLPFSALGAGNTVWNAKTKSFSLKRGPSIIRLAADSNSNGTSVKAFYSHTADLKALGDLYNAAFHDDDRLYAEALGLEQDDVDADLEVGVQIAYSFDGKTWVYDWETHAQEHDDPPYYLQDRFDLDGDGFEEYVDLPGENINTSLFFDSQTVFDGTAGILCPGDCSPAEGMSIRQALTLRNNALLQGKGEFTGSDYIANDDNWSRGFAVDFNQHTLYAKARYRVYNALEIKENDDWKDYGKTVSWSDWGPVKTYNNKSASAKGQDCIPDVNVLKDAAAPTLSILATDRRTIERDGVMMKTTRFNLALDYPASVKTALSRFFALPMDVREELTGEYYDPGFAVEIRVGEGDWYFFNDYSFNDTLFDFDDDVYWHRDILEELGYQPGDPVYLRARLYGSNSWETKKEEGEPHEKLYRADTYSIWSAPSAAVELSLTGKYRVTYELNGGSFLYGTEQVSMFDEDTELTVDLTSKDYRPERAHFTFDGWYSDESFAKDKCVTSFDTSVKASRTYYAKWTEVESYAVAYDFGVVTDAVYNPNPERIWADDGIVGLGNVEYAGANFLGWFTAAEGGKQVTALSYSSMKSDTTLYAHWEFPSKTITYAGAGKEYTNAQKNPSSYRINPDGANTICIYAPEKTGYLFDGWYLSKDMKSGALPYDQEQGCWLLNESENVTLYASFILGKWGIRYELGLTDVWNGDNPEQYTYGTPVQLKEPTRVGYTFDGWYADEAYKTAVSGIRADDDGEKTFYAKWTAIAYKIKYDLRDSANLSLFKNENPSERLIDDEIVLKPLTPTSKEYKFLGWYDNVNYDGDPYEKIAAGTDKDVTVYARFFRYSWGDVDFDGDITAGDARLALRQAVGLEDLPADALAWADVDEPGAKHVITAADARVILRMAVGLDTAEALKLPQYPAGF